MFSFCVCVCVPALPSFIFCDIPSGTRMLASPPTKLYRGVQEYRDFGLSFIYFVSKLLIYWERGRYLTFEDIKMIVISDLFLVGTRSRWLAVIEVTGKLLIHKRGLTKRKCLAFSDVAADDHFRISLFIL